MRRNYGIYIVSALLVMLAAAVPIVMALHVAKQIVQKDEWAYLTDLADRVLRRGITSRMQLVTALEEMKQEANAPCSESSMTRMRRLSINLSYVQVIGAVKDGKLVCSALGLHGDGIELTGDRGTTATGIQAWNGTQLPFAPGQTFNVYARDGFAAVMHPEVVVDVPVRDVDVALALLISKPKFITRSKGDIRPEWVERYTLDQSGQWDTGDHLIVVKTSSEHNLAGMAVAPKSHIQQQLAVLASALVPIGMLVSVLLALAVVVLARRRMSLRSEIRLALKRREFFLHYQPVVDLRTGRWAGAEALLRWRGADGKLVPPDIFIPVAEQSGLIQDITRLVMDKVATDLPAMLRLQPEFHVAINLSAHDLKPDGPLAHLQALLKAQGIPSRNLVVEVTERCFVDVAVAKPLINHMREIGVSVAIDDFGTGYSSLSTLESFEIDCLKIDKSFISSIGTEAASSLVVPHIIEMAKTLRLLMIAEGVETQAQADYLRASGVQHAQGWLYAKAMPVEDLMAHLRQAAKAE